MVSRNGPRFAARRIGWMSARIALLASLATVMATTYPSAPLFADTKAGVDAWEAGDYDSAVAEWRAAAQAGDADAAFNLGQAYKVGRGVPQDLDLALNWYRQAMEAGHVRASDYYGLLLYQTARKQEAMPYIRQSAARGEPRAQYVLGAELFNGTMIEKDWVRAYAMMTRASAQGLEPANRVLSEMDQHIPLEQRQQGVALANTLEQREASSRIVQMGNWDLRPIDQANEPAATIASTSAPPPKTSRPIESVQLPPSQAAAKVSAAPAPSAPTSARTEPAAINNEPEPVVNASIPASKPAPAQPKPATSTPPRAAPPKSGPSSTAIAADGLPVGYVPSVGPRAVNQPKRVNNTGKSAAPAPRKSAPVAVSGNWRVQMGAYSALDRAQRVWKKYLKKVSGLNSYQPYLVKSGGLVKLQYGPFESRAAALKSCRTIEAAGGACFALRK